jgi:hypothetical protein
MKMNDSQPPENASTAEFRIICQTRDAATKTTDYLCP